MSMEEDLRLLMDILGAAEEPEPSVWVVKCHGRKHSLWLGPSREPEFLFQWTEVFAEAVEFPTRAAAEEKAALYPGSLAGGAAFATRHQPRPMWAGEGGAPFRALIRIVNRVVGDVQALRDEVAQIERHGGRLYK